VISIVKRSNTGIIEPGKDSGISIYNDTVMGAAIMKHVKGCPVETCRKKNVKVGEDNWVVCSQCMSQYCFLCGNKVRNAEHFGKKCHRFTPI